MSNPKPHLWPGKLNATLATTVELTREVRNEKTFHIGQHYDEQPAKLIECSICGGREFNVGRGSHYTAIRCKCCEWETCIHSG